LSYAISEDLQSSLHFWWNIGKWIASIWLPFGINMWKNDRIGQIIDKINFLKEKKEQGNYF
jgi:hypothetical protein